jgi:outer membrane protein OmpA-like peptidoglycan-associated protein
MCRLILFVVSALFASAWSAAAQDVEGSRDHPLVSRYPGYVIVTYEEQEFGAHEFYIGDTERRVEGRYWRIEYEIPENGRKGGPLQIGRNYTNLFVSRGGQVLEENIDSGGGRAVARLPMQGRNVWLEISISNDGEIYELTIVEEAGMEQKVEFSAADLSRLLAAGTAVAVRGILFDTGQAVIRPESAPVLAEIGTLLRNEPALALMIEGHTDNVGNAAANLQLSEQRARAVKAHLVSTFAIDPSRLTTAGRGDTRPVAPNTTEEGRAQNRRVELVKR